MNDSFLEDFDLIPKGSKTQSSSQVKQRVYITKRTGVLTQPSSVLKSNNDNNELKQDKIISSSSTTGPKVKLSRQSRVQDTTKKVVQSQKPLSSTPKSDKEDPNSCKTLKPIENKIEPTNSKNKSKEAALLPRLKDNIPIIDKFSAKSVSAGSINHIDATKENAQPTGSSSKEISSQQETKRSSNTSDNLFTNSKDEKPASLYSLSSIESGSSEIKKEPHTSNTKRVDILEKTDPVMLLNAIKDIVRGYTEHEANVILKAMNDLYINSQANFIKQMMLQTDDLIRELNLKKSNENVQLLIEENERMREDIYILRTRNEVLQKRIDEMSLVKEENFSLKLKLKEFQQ